MIVAEATAKPKMTATEARKLGGIARWSGVSRAKRTNVTTRASKLGVAARKNCEHPEDRREIACSFCTRTVARMRDGEMIRVKLAAFRKSDSTLPQVIARAECRHPKKKLRTICGFCRKPLPRKHP